MAVAAAALLAALAPSAARATVPADLCTGNPCNVTGTITIDPGSILDFGATDLRIKSTANLSIGLNGGSLREAKLLARSIVLEPGADLLGDGDFVSWRLEATAGGIDVQSSGSTVSKIDVSALEAGDIELVATGDITVSGTLDARGSGADATGGAVLISSSGGSVTINRDVLFGAKNSFGFGGQLTVESQGPVLVNGILDGGAPGDGADIDIFAATGNVTVSKRIDASGGNPEGAGGAVTITAPGGAILLNALLSSTAGSGPEEACSDGGDVTLTAGTDISVAADINVNGGTGCGGGTITARAGGTFTQQAGADIRLIGPGTFGVGGSFDLQADAGATLRLVDAGSALQGGSIKVVAFGGTISILNRLDASGTGSFGFGGVVDIQGCNVSMASTGRTDTRGTFVVSGTGVTSLRAGGMLTVAGTMLANEINELRVKFGAPVVTGTVTPPATVVVSPGLPDCIQLAQCGDNNLDPSEACDDGNTEACDGCNSDCTRVDAQCGDARAECSEQCDDGNDVDDDACRNDCTLPGAAGVRLVGSPYATGCLAQWELRIADPAISSSTNLPSHTQSCVDGDPGCDADGENDLSCSFDTRICLRVPDPRVPVCSSDPIVLSMLKYPQSLTSGYLIDRQNAATIVDALKTLGGTVRIASTVVQSGPALSTFDNCTPSFDLVVPRTATRIGQKRFNILADDFDGTRMNTNELNLECLINDAVCGNGVLEPTEQCDDGNQNACDGCTAGCRIEICGDGIVQCNEQCDEGPANGSPGSRCSNTCRERPPALRIPGGGTTSLDCAFEWAMEIAESSVVLDRKGRPKVLQTCYDNDPLCDFDPAVGTCRMRVWGCLGVVDTRLACTPLQATGFATQSPGRTAKGNLLVARTRMEEAGFGLSFPSAPGEQCTSRIDLDVPVSKRPLSFKVKTLLVNKKSDTDFLKLRCLAPPL